MVDHQPSLSDLHKSGSKPRHPVDLDVETPSRIMRGLVGDSVPSTGVSEGLPKTPFQNITTVINVEQSSSSKTRKSKTANSKSGSILDKLYNDELIYNGGGSSNSSENRKPKGKKSMIMGFSLMSTTRTDTHQATARMADLRVDEAHHHADIGHFGRVPIQGAGAFPRDPSMQFRPRNPQRRSSVGYGLGGQSKNHSINNRLSSSDYNALMATNDEETPPFRSVQSEWIELHTLRETYAATLREYNPLFNFNENIFENLREISANDSEYRKLYVEELKRQYVEEIKSLLQQLEESISQNQERDVELDAALMQLEQKNKETEILTLEIQEKSSDKHELQVIQKDTIAKEYESLKNNLRDYFKQELKTEDQYKKLGSQYVHSMLEILLETIITCHPRQQELKIIENLFQVKHNDWIDTVRLQTMCDVHQTEGQQEVDIAENKVKVDQVLQLFEQRNNVAKLNSNSAFIEDSIQICNQFSIYALAPATYFNGNLGVENLELLYA